MDNEMYEMLCAEMDKLWERCGLTKKETTTSTSLDNFVIQWEQFLKDKNVEKHEFQKEIERRMDLAEKGIS